MNESENKRRIRAAKVGFVFTLGMYAAITPELFGQQPAAAQSSPTLLVQSDLDCSFALDDGASETLKAGAYKRLPITLGEHLVTAVSPDGKDRFTKVVDADKPVQRVVLIELQKVRAARQKDEKEAAQLERDIKAKRDQADKLKTETASATALQQAINSRKSEIQEQIAGLQKQVQQEQAAAQGDDANTQQARSCVASEPKTTLGSLVAAGCTAEANQSDNSARAHRANVVNLQNQILDLNRQLARPDGGLATGLPSPSTQQSPTLELGQPSVANSLPSGQQQSFKPITPSGLSVSRSSDTTEVSGAAALRLQHSTSRGVTLTTDMDCIVAIDGTLVGRVQKDHRDFFPASAGKHTFSVATKAGDYWDKRVEIAGMTNLFISISFQKARADRAALEQNMSALRKQGDEKQRELAGIQIATELASQELQSARRHSIVEAFNYYLDRWGKELGMRHSRNNSSEAIDNTLSTQGIQNLGNTDTTSQNANNLAMGVEMLMSHNLKAKARINELAAQAAEARISYLGKALEEPLKYRPDSDALGYVAAIRPVTHNKQEGKLTTAPDSIEYLDSSGVEHIPCSLLISASGSNQLHLQYSVERDGKLQRKSLDVRAVPESDQDLLLGNVYLACPRLTQ